MKIEHFAMYVLDLEGAKDFFVRYFDAPPNNYITTSRPDSNPIFCLSAMARGWRL